MNDTKRQQLYRILLQSDHICNLIKDDPQINQYLKDLNRVAGTMVARSCSVQVTARSNPSQVPPLLMHVGKWGGRHV